MSTIYIVGDIDSDMVKYVSESLEEKTSMIDPVRVELHSTGGTAYDALAIYHLFKSSQHHIIVEAFGTVQSAAVLILAAGDFRYIAPETVLMVHEDSDCEPLGSLTNARKMSKQMLKEEHQWAQVLSSCTKTSAIKWYRMHKKTTYLTAIQAIELGLADEILEYT